MKKIKCIGCESMLEKNGNLLVKHFRNCVKYNKVKQNEIEYIQKNWNNLIEDYKNLPSILGLLDKHLPQPRTSNCYTIINNKFKKEGIFKGNDDPEHKKYRHKLAMKTLKRKYGVSNWGQMSDGGWRIMNKIPKKDVPFREKFNIYSEKVQKLTSKNKSKMVQPKNCYLTGITFADEFCKANPNDYRKKTCDHKESVLKCFLSGKTPEECASPDNLIFICRYANSVKGNMSIEDFKKNYSKLLIENFNENNK